VTGRIFLALYISAFAALLALVLVFNFDEKADFCYWPGRRLEQVPLVYLVLGGLVLGAVYASLVSFIEQARLGLTIRSLRRRLARLERAQAATEPIEPLPSDTLAKPLEAGGDASPPDPSTRRELPWNP
jgi:uncharacterized integral membrane protein